MGHTGHTGTEQSHAVRIPSGEATLEGESSVPVGANGVVLFAHGSGSSRHSQRNQYVARRICESGVGTLLFDLLTREEEAVDMQARHRLGCCILVRCRFEVKHCSLTAA